MNEIQYLLESNDLKILFESGSNNELNLYLESSLDSTPTDIEHKKEDGLDVTIFTAILQEAEAPNRNGRIYTKKAIDEALHRKMVQEKIQHKKWYGESSHPAEQTTERQTRIVKSNISHIVTDFWWQGNLLYGRIETANTACGRDFQGLIRQGSDSSFSMRGLGGDNDKTKDGYEFIDSNLFIMCYDEVDFPSHEKAYQQKILKEDFSLNTDLLSNSANKVINESSSIIKVTKNEVKDLLNSRTCKNYFEESDRDILSKYLMSL